MSHQDAAVRLALSPRDCARAFGIHERIVYAAIREGKLIPRTPSDTGRGAVSRIWASDLELWFRTYWQPTLPSNTRG